MIWNGYKSEVFQFEGKKAIVVFPEKADEKKNWLIKTEYWGAFPDRELDLVQKGFHLVYLENESRFAAKSDCDRKARFTDFLSEKYGLRDKCVPVGMSLGGAHAMNFAGFYPDKVSCLFLDAPVLNFYSLPGKFGKPEWEAIWDNEFLKAYPGMHRADLLNFDNHPINKARILKEKRIPILMLWGTEDNTVDYLENGKLLEDEYSDMPELLKVIPRPWQGHHPHGDISDPGIIINWILEKTR